MKKASKLLILAVCLLALVLAITLVACDGGAQKTAHSDHTASGDWQSDESGHWHVCDEGGEKTDVAAHNLIAQEQDGKHYFKCEVCNYTTEPEAHTPSETYASDGTYHWQECSVCHLPVNKQVHNPSGEVENIGIGHRFKCEVCQKTIEGAHAFDEENPASDEQNHWLECLYCDATTQPEAHTLGEYIIDGERHSQQCEECGATVNEAAHKANYALGYFADESGHWYECDCGQKMEFAAHEKNEASYTSNESEHWYSCKICLYQIEAEAHTLGEYISDGVKHYKQCSVCQRKAMMEDCVPSAQHVSADGEEYHNCETCGKKVLSSAEEFYEMDEDDHWRACPVCKKQLGDKVAHTGFTKYEFSIEGHWYVCDVCHNRVLSEHNYEDDICTECNYFEGLEYWTFAQDVDNGKWYVTDYTGTQKVVKLPTRDAEGHNIIGLKSGVFCGDNDTDPHNDYMEEVYIPEGYTYIAYGAFRHCASLKKAHLPSTLKTFFGQLFANAPLDELYIEDLAAFVQANCSFLYASDLPFLTYGDKTLTASHTIDLYVQGELVKDMVIPEGVTQLGFGIFANNCFGLNSITLPRSLTLFSARAITASCDNYGKDVFAESDISRWVPKIVVPDYETFLLNCKMDAVAQDQGACRQLNEIDVVFMKDGEPVTDLVLPEGVTTLGNYQFLASDNITTITVNEQFLWSRYIFYGCKNLRAIRNLENTKVNEVSINIFDGLKLDEPIKLPATCISMYDPGDTDVPIYFAKGVLVTLYGITRYRGKEIAIDDVRIGSAGTGFRENVKLDRVYFYNEANYNKFVENYRKNSVSEDMLSYAIGVRAIYEAEAILYSEECPADFDLQCARWHFNEDGEIELWSKTVNGDQVTIERDEEFWRDGFYHDITNDGGDEYTYRLKAAAESGKEIVWTSLTEGATVTQDGDVTATKIGTYKIKAAVKDNEAIYSIVTVTFYPSAFYFTGKLGGVQALENVDKNAGNLGDREDLKFVDDGTHKKFVLYVNLAKDDTFSVGYLGSDVKLGKTVFDRNHSSGYQSALNLNGADDSFKMRSKKVVTITVTINDDNTVSIVMAFKTPPTGYDLTVRGRNGNDATNTVYATANLDLSKNFGSVFKVSVIYTATLNSYLNISFGFNNAGETAVKYYVAQTSLLQLSGDAYSTDTKNATNYWVSFATNDLHIWYQSSADGSGNSDSWEFVFTVRADGELLAVEINFAKDAEE